MALVIPPALIESLVGSVAAGALSPVLTNITNVLGIAKAPANAASPATTTPSASALSMPLSAWSKLSPDVQSVMIAANPQGIHLTAG